MVSCVVPVRARSMLERQKHGLLQGRFLRIVTAVRHPHVETEYPLGHCVPLRGTGVPWGRVVLHQHRDIGLTPNSTT